MSQLSPIAAALTTLPDLTADQRRDLEYEIAWSWAIVRRTDRAQYPVVVRYRTSDAARAAMAMYNIIHGWALLFDPEGRVVLRHDGAPL